VTYCTNSIFAQNITDYRLPSSPSTHVSANEPMAINASLPSEDTDFSVMTFGTADSVFTTSHSTRATFNSDSNYNIQPGAVSLSSDGEQLIFPKRKVKGKEQYAYAVNFNKGKKPTYKNINLGVIDADDGDYFPLALSGKSKVLAFGNDSTGSKDYSAGIFSNYMDPKTKSQISGFQSNSDLDDVTICLSDNGQVMAIADSDDYYGTGFVQLYRMKNKKWTLIQTMKGTTTGERFGHSISLDPSGTYLAVGSLEKHIRLRGNVRTYKYNKNKWSRIGQTLVGSNSYSYSKFGYSVSMSSNGKPRVAVGISGFRVGKDDVGQCIIYQLNPSNKWAKIANSINGSWDDGEFGYRVSLSSGGNHVAVSIKDPDTVRIYQYKSGKWSKTDEFKENIKHYGTSIDLNANGSVLAVAAEGKNDRGAVFVYNVGAKKSG